MSGHHLILAPIAMLSVLAACGGGSDNGDGGTTPGTAGYVPVIVSDDLAVGENRFALGLIDSRDNSPVLDARLHARFFSLAGTDAILKAETDLEPVRITRTYTHTHDDGTVESHEAGETGVYIANVGFDTAGQWGVELTGTLSGTEIGPLRPGVEVRAESSSPAVGEPAPRSRQLTSADVADLRDIDTSVTPIPKMHDMTIADAVSSGRPTVIVFATPAFCTSQICGPAKQIVDDLFAEYEGHANFVHVEPYDVEKARNGEGLVIQPFLIEEWGLTSEPWIFIVDDHGVISAKFQGIITADELQAALTPLVSA